MANIPDGEPTKVIRDPAWVPGEQVTILTYAGSGIQQKIKDALVSFSPGEDGKPAIQYLAGRAASVKLHAAIVDWTIYTASGKDFPFTDANVDRLPDAYADFILAEVNTAWDTWKTATAPVVTGNKKGDARAEAAFRQGAPVAAPTEAATSAAEEATG